MTSDTHMKALVPSSRAINTTETGICWATARKLSPSLIGEEQGDRGGEM